MAERMIPEENFEGGLLRMDIPELGEAKQGKVRESWVVANPRGSGELRVMVTTDRQSAYDVVLATTPGKGAALNLTSAFWFREQIVPSHMLTVPHPNVLIAKQAIATLPVEVVLRRFMARSSSSTSVCRHYNEGERTIYGINFPEGLLPNQEFPMGTIVTPTTKAEAGQHDEMITDEESRDVVNGKLGKGIWERTKEYALDLFSAARQRHLAAGLILVDTKYEFGLDDDGQVMLIDEVHTPDSSRLWKASTYIQRMAEGKDPESFDKEILRRWLAEHGFTGEGDVPTIDSAIKTQMTEAYKVPYQMVTGFRLSEVDSRPEVVKQAIFDYLEKSRFV